MAAAIKEYFIVAEKMFSQSLKEVLSVHRTMEEAIAARDIYDFTFYSREILSSKSFPIKDELYEAYFAEIDRLKKAKETYDAYLAEVNYDEVNAAAKEAFASYDARYELFKEECAAGKTIDFEAFMADALALRESARNARDDVCNNAHLRELYNAQFDTKDFAVLKYELKKLLNLTAFKCSDCGCLTYTGCVCRM